MSEENFVKDKIDKIEAQKQELRSKINDPSEGQKITFLCVDGFLQTFDDWAFDNCIQAGLGRGELIYENTKNDKATVFEAKRVAFREEIKNKLNGLIDQYKKPTVSDEERNKNHIKNIEVLQHNMSDLKTKKGDSFSSKEILANGGLSFGRAQKLLNLYLKYMWMAGEIEEPPHCPVDAFVIDELKKDKDARENLSSMASWTSSGFIKKDYLEVMRIINDEATKKDPSIARWELSAWNNWRKKQDGGDADCSEP